MDKHIDPFLSPMGQKAIRFATEQFILQQIEYVLENSGSGWHLLSGRIERPSWWDRFWHNRQPADLRNWETSAPIPGSGVILSKRRGHLANDVCAVLKRDYRPDVSVFFYVPHQGIRIFRMGEWVFMLRSLYDELKFREERPDVIDRDRRFKPLKGDDLYIRYKEQFGDG